MPNVFHPWQDIEGANEDVVGSVKVNLTFAPTITTIGGTQQFDLRYTCRKDLCSGKELLKFVIIILYSLKLLLCGDSGGHAAARGLGVLGLFSLALATALISSSN